MNPPASITSGPSGTSAGTSSRSAAPDAGRTPSSGPPGAPPAESGTGSPSTTDTRSTPSRPRSVEPPPLRRLVRALAAEIAPLRALIPRESPGLSGDSIRQWPAWKGAACPLCGAFSPVLFPAEPDGGTACSDCPDDPAFSAARSLFPYREEIRDTIRAAKYGRVPLAADALADRLLRALREEMADLVPDSVRPAIVPVPIHPRKYFRRGFHLPALVGRALARRTGWPFAPLLLRRTREGSPQAGLPLSLRAANVRGSFARPRGGKPPPEILLLDDVYTTGATAAECARALKRGGAEHIVVLTVARAVP